MDRMDSLIAEAVRQGFQVWQTRRGVWVFRKSAITVTWPPPTIRHRQERDGHHDE